MGLHFVQESIFSTPLIAGFPEDGVVRVFLILVVDETINVVEISGMTAVFVRSLQGQNLKSFNQILTLVFLRGEVGSFSFEEVDIPFVDIVECGFFFVILNEVVDNIDRFSQSNRQSVAVFHRSVLFQLYEDLLFEVFIVDKDADIVEQMNQSSKRILTELTEFYCQIFLFELAGFNNGFLLESHPAERIQKDYFIIDA
jgi:hypothetical protein